MRPFVIMPTVACLCSGIWNIHIYIIRREKIPFFSSPRLCSRLCVYTSIRKPAWMSCWGPWNREQLTVEQPGTMGLLKGQWLLRPRHGCHVDIFKMWTNNFMLNPVYVCLLEIASFYVAQTGLKVMAILLSRLSARIKITCHHA